MRNLKTQNKNLFTRIKTGIKKGALTPTLPENILNFQSKPIIRIIRVIGGISCLSLLGKNLISLTGFYIYIAIFFTLIFWIYHLYIAIIRVKHIKFLIKSNELDIRNSPFDRLATLVAKAVLCSKGICETAQPVGTTLGLMLGIDEALKAANRPKIFTPLLGGALNAVLPESEKTKLANRITQNQFKIDDLKETTDWAETWKKGFKNASGLDKQDQNELVSLCNELKQVSDDAIKKVAEDSKELIKKFINKD